MNNNFIEEKSIYQIAKEQFDCHQPKISILFSDLYDEFPYFNEMDNEFINYRLDITYKVTEDYEIINEIETIELFYVVGDVRYRGYEEYIQVSENDNLWDLVKEHQEGIIIAIIEGMDGMIEETINSDEFIGLNDTNMILDLYIQNELPEYVKEELEKLENIDKYIEYYEKEQ